LNVSDTLPDQIATFLRSIVSAMGANLTATVEETAEGTRINLEGDGGMLLRRDAEGLQALQHLVATAFRRQLGDDRRIVVDCNGFRQEKDAELREMARFVAEKARATGMPQEIGPLNPYERRIVHIAIAEDPTVSSESIGDAFMKTVIIGTLK
jgi:spoIIIJ-associated protein